MSTFTKNSITLKGAVAIAALVAGGTLEFTRIAVGDGNIPSGQTAMTMTNLAHRLFDVDINQVYSDSESQATVVGIFNNSQTQTGFYYRELGLFAKDPASGEEILFCYGNAEDQAEWISPAGEESVIEKEVRIVTLVGNATEVTANLKSGIYLTQEMAQKTYFPYSGGTITGFVTIDGVTTLRDSLVVANDIHAQANVVKHVDVVAGTAPSQRQHGSMTFIDKNSKALATLEHVIDTDKTNKLSLLVSNFKGTPDELCGIIVQYGEGLNPVIMATHSPIQGSNDKSVVTTEWANFTFLKNTGGTVNGDIILNGNLNLFQTLYGYGDVVLNNGYSDVTKGTAPSSVKSKHFIFTDKTLQKRFAAISHALETNGNNTLGLFVFNPNDDTEEEYGGLYLSWANGKPLLSLTQSPDQSSNNTEIATTGFVKGLIATTSEYGLVRLASETDVLKETDNTVMDVPLAYELNDFRRMSKAYSVGDKVNCAFKFEYFLECTQAGTTSNKSLDTRNVTFGQTITDGTVKWVVRAHVKSVNGSVPDANGNVTIDIDPDEYKDWGLGTGVGDGVNASQKFPSLDLNDIDKTGFYSLSETWANIPEDAGQVGLLQHIERRWTAGTSAIQIYSGGTGSSNLWFRIRAAGNWQAWKKIANQADVDSIVTLTNNGLQTFDDGADYNTLVDPGFYGLPNNGSTNQPKASAFRVIVFSNKGSNYVTQLAVPIYDTASANADSSSVYFRSRNGNGDTWSTWRQLALTDYAKEYGGINYGVGGGLNTSPSGSADEVFGSSDLNDWTKSGFYSVSITNGQNTPTGQASWTGILLAMMRRWETGTSGLQIAPNGSSFYYRTRSGSTWNPWYILARDDQVVHLTGNETIAGKKTFSDNVFISGHATRQIVKNIGINKGETPSASQDLMIRLVGGDGSTIVANTFAEVELCAHTSGDTYVRLYASDNSSSGATARDYIEIRYNKSTGKFTTRSPHPETSSNNNNQATTKWTRDLLQRAVGKTEPTLTALVDWEAMKAENNGNDVRNINNTTYGIKAYGGDSGGTLAQGDIILKESYENYDALLVEYTNDDGFMHASNIIPMWKFKFDMNSKGLVRLITDPGARWNIRGRNNTTAPSTTTRLEIWPDGQDCGIIEIHGIKY